jgi:serine/threonine protein phosphatase PrpC
MEAAVISEQGKRPFMEDFYYLDLNFGGKGWIYGGIYDGHGGDYAAKYSSERLHLAFLDDITYGLSPQKAFSHSYQVISDELMAQDTGTTAIDFFIRDEQVHVANCGDSRAIILAPDWLKELTVEHRLDNPEERSRIIKAGGEIAYPYVQRGGRGLMPTRTIGDPYFKTVGIISQPHTSSYVIGKEEFMLMAACDGLFDVMGLEEIADFARRNPYPQYLVGDLSREVLNNRSGSDNVTIIAVSISSNVGS